MAIRLSSSEYSSQRKRWKEKEEDREGQEEVEEEERLKEVRSWMIMEMK